MKGPADAFPEVDLHGMTKEQARICLEAKLRAARPSVYRIRVIHGYHGGTELRDLVRKTIAKHPRVLRYEVGLNPGETELVLRELY